MIDYKILRQLVLEVLAQQSKPQFGQFVVEKIGTLVAQRNLFPTEDECRERRVDYQYYRRGQLNPIDEMNVNQIIWDLIIDRVITIGADDVNTDWPFLRFTEFGKFVIKADVTHYDPDGYLATLKTFASPLDPVIEQYALEGLHCFSQRLLFASAVMFGAAAETTVLLLLQSIRDATIDPKKKSDVTNLLERGRLPIIFDAIRDTVDSLAKANIMPYSVHQGAMEHLLSLFEMIRIQRNEAVHPTAGQVDRTKVFLTIQSFPATVGVTYRLMNWFSNNQI